LASDGGNSPEKLLFLKFNVWIKTREPSEAGILPEKLLPAKLRMFSSLHVIQQSGISPERQLSERSRYNNLSQAIEQRLDIVPENKFLERFNIVALSGSGKEPCKKFELISTVAESPTTDGNLCASPVI
jgi:hypothetical protein